MRTFIFFFSFFTSYLVLEFQIYLRTFIIKTFSTIPIIQKAVRAVAKEFLKAANSPMNVFLKSLVSAFHRYTVSSGFQSPIIMATSGFHNPIDMFTKGFQKFFLT
jgi:hypothetical protein